MEVAKLLALVVALGFTYLIDKQMNKDMSSGFSIGMLWITFVRLMVDSFYNRRLLNDKSLFFK